MAESRLIQKQLAGKEDLLLGIGTVKQGRASGIKTITKLNATHFGGVLVVDTINDLNSLDKNQLDEQVVFVKETGNTHSYNGTSWVNKTTVTVENIEDLATYTGLGAVIVKDISRGGAFVSKTEADIDPNTGSVYTVNGGTVFAKLGGGFWVRQYDGAVDVKWFGAKGDGVTDDTQAFIDFEAAYIGRTIDMHGLTFKVSKTFTKNIYKNCLWLVDSTLVPANGELLSETAAEFDVGVMASESAASVYRVLYARGRGKRRTLQTFGSDGKYIYTNHNTQIDGNATIVSVVNRFVDENRIVASADSYALPEDRLGHQGMGVQTTDNGEVTLWTAAPGEPKDVPYHPDFDFSVGGSRGVVSFKFKDASSGEIDTPIQYRLVAASQGAGSVLSPTITTDGKWMIVRYTGNSVYNNQVFRIFSMSVFDGVNLDVSNKFTHEFELKLLNITRGESIHSLSGFCSDGKHLYGVAAGWCDPITQPKYIFSCDLLGYDLRSAKTNVGETLAPEYAAEDVSWMETEGMAFVRVDGKLVPMMILITEGKSVSYTQGRSLSMLISLGVKTRKNANNFEQLYLIPKDKKNLNILHSIEAYEWPSTNPDVTNNASFFNRNGTGYAGGFARSGVPMLAVYSSTTNVALVTQKPEPDFILGANGWHWVINPKGNFLPYSNAENDIGSSNRRINNSYFAVAPTVSSDERLKSNFKGLSTAEKAAALDIKNSIGLYQLNSSIEKKGVDGARWHCGVKAQQVVSILQSHGLEWSKYAFIGYDEWEEQEEVVESWDDEYDEAGTLVRQAGSEIVQPYQAGGNAYSIRYEELLAFVLAAL